MTVACDTARKWTCGRCEMSVSQVDHESVPLPVSWASSADGDFCLACRRERAAEEALATAPNGATNGDRAKLRRDGLIEFEVRRTPDRPDNAIAKACRSSASAVAAARARLPRNVAGRR